MGRYYDVYAFRIGDPDARRVAILFADVSARRSAEERLRDLNTSLEQRVASAIAERDRTWNNAQDLLLVLDGEGLIRAANPAWTTVLGWAPQEVVGRKNLDFVHPDDHVATVQAVATAASGALPSVDIRCLHRDGSYRRIAWVAAPEGDLIYASGRDVTAEREQAEALTLAQEALRHAQRMEALGQLTGGVAHDFNNLLAVIMANLEVLEGFASGEARMAKAVRNAVQGAERGAALTQRLLAFARKQDLQTEPVDVAALVTGLSDMLQDTVGDAISVETRVSAPVAPALVDPSQLELAILNLAVNARDAMPDGGQLLVVVEQVEVACHAHLQAGGYVRVRVTDTGTGMDEATLRRAVEPFFTTKPVGRGTGLGLSMIHGLAAQSQGAFTLDSALGQGTTAEILLPVAPALDVPQDRAKESAPAAGAQRELLVLVVDDDVAVLEGTVTILDSLGHTALAALSGEQALALVSAYPDIDAVLTDVAMPGLSGIELAREIAKRRANLPVILVSGYPEVPAGEGLPRLAKPFRRDALSHLLARVVQPR
jgi:PAS domain S-box-containing protein